ncbi:hypothetical protein V6615_00230 [Oscillospiraceae bacterium PP1C4]
MIKSTKTGCMLHPVLWQTENIVDNPRERVYTTLSMAVMGKNVYFRHREVRIGESAQRNKRMPPLSLSAMSRTLCER